MTRNPQEQVPALMSIGIDIGKDVFHIVGFDPGGRIALRRKIKRLALVNEFKKLPRCIVGMEACLSAHFISRTLRELGFEPRIIPAKYTKPEPTKTRNSPPPTVNRCRRSTSSISSTWWWTST